MTRTPRKARAKRIGRMKRRWLGLTCRTHAKCMGVLLVSWLQIWKAKRAFYLGEKLIRKQSGEWNRSGDLQGTCSNGAGTACQGLLPEFTSDQVHLESDVAMLLMYAPVATVAYTWWILMDVLECFGCHVETGLACDVPVAELERKLIPVSSADLDQSLRPNLPNRFQTDIKLHALKPSWIYYQ